MDELSAQELIDRSGATAERLRRLVELGIGGNNDVCTGGPGDDDVRNCEVVS